MRIAFINGAMLLGGRPYDFKNLWGSSRGTTGSEISILCYAREMANRGHDVAFYVDGANADHFEKVKVRPLKKWTEEAGAYDVAYSWMQINYLEHLPAHVLRVVNQQLNDFGYTTRLFDQHVDVYTSPSQNHLERMAPLSGSPEKWVVVPNGCYPNRYDATKKVPGRVVYTSSPDRGLHLLLWAWPHIRRVVPNATLRIFYFSLQRWLADAEKHAASGIPDIQEHARRARYISRVLENAESLGITVIGSASREALERELSEAQVLGFPCDVIAYTEGFSVATLEGCASGALPIVSKVDALESLYGDCVPMVDVPAHEHMGDWLEYAVRALTDEPWRLGWCSKARALAEEFAWPKLAEELERTLDDQLEKHAKKRGHVSRAVMLAKTESSVKIEAVRSKPVIEMVLTKEAASGQEIDFDALEKDAYGGGARAGFLGLAKALGEIGGYDLRVFSTFKAAKAEGGVAYFPIEQIGNHIHTADALVAYHDISPLVGLSTGALRVASHHSYQPYPGPSFGWCDVNTAPSEHCMRALRAHYDPWGTWYVMPNGVADPGVVRKPVKGRVIHHGSPSRGLHLLLRVWPQIRAAVPDATLHVIGPVKQYAFELYGEQNREPGQPGKRAKWIRDGLLSAEAAGGLTVMNQLPRKDLLRELGEASVFAFPCSVQSPCESFSISVMECLKISLPVVLSPTDALGGIYEGSLCMTPAPAENHLAEFGDKVIEVLRMEEEQLASWGRLGKRLADGFTFARKASVLNSILGKHLGVIEQAESRELHLNGFGSRADVPGVTL